MEWASQPTPHVPLLEKQGNGLGKKQKQKEQKTKNHKLKTGSKDAPPKAPGLRKQPGVF